MPPPPLPYVDSATIKGKRIIFRVDVTDFKDSQGFIEISGEATQDSGAFATIYAIVKVPKRANGVGDDKGKYYVNVSAGLIPDHPFRKDRDVTVFVRVSKVWVTVLGEQASAGPPKLTRAGEANEGTTWNKLRSVTAISKPSQSSTSSDSTASSGQPALRRWRTRGGNYQENPAAPSVRRLLQELAI
jgi:hypothetical protein